jgi:hypothetical protein
VDEKKERYRLGNDVVFDLEDQAEFKFVWLKIIQAMLPPPPLPSLSLSLAYTPMCMTELYPCSLHTYNPSRSISSYRGGAT